MKIAINHYFLLFCFVVSLASYSQNNTLCSGDKYEDFNFWEGNWNVYDQNKNLIGENKLVKMQDNCVLQENWVSKTSKNRGTSYNYFDKNDNMWHQIWIDNSGNVLNLKGGLINNVMVLRSNVISDQNGKYYNEVSWSPKKDGSVLQVWNIFNEDGKLVKEAFRGLYIKKKI